jgi:putative ABC transport system permease protein
MNLAYKDIRHNLGRFGLTAFGIGMLLMIVMGMVGIYRGMIYDATLLIDRLGADLWIVQNGTRGPFAEVSRIPKSLLDRAAVVPGVMSSREFVYHTVQREHVGKPLRMAVLGLSWPKDKGEGLPLVKGRALAQSRFEMIADERLGVSLGETLRLGKETYTVVGITRGMTSSGGDGLAFLSVTDAQVVQFDSPGEAVRVERASRYARAARTDTGLAQPALIERAAGLSSAIPALGPPALSAVIVTLAPGVDPSSVVSIMSAWSDISVYTAEQQRQFMLRGTVEMARKQIGLFTALLTFISAIIMALILYTLTLEKLHEIALLKLIGAPSRVILSMILEQALFLAAVGFGVAYVLGQWIFPKFPRRVVLLQDDLLALGAIVLVISVLASVLGIYRALRVDPNEALSG